MLYYAGIGSRQTPDHILTQMTNLAQRLYEKNYTLRSGGAVGADRAFEKGAKEKKTIFYARNTTEESIKLASEYHPAWDKCNDYVRKLHGRNSLILLGLTLKLPVRFVVCWTPNGAVTGGTGLGIKIAMDRGITIYNLAVQGTMELIEKEIFKQ